MSRAVGREPVKEIPITSSCSTRGTPTSSPNPRTVLYTPAGSPASRKISPSTWTDRQDNSDGLCTAELPYAKHGAILNEDSIVGPFHGVMIPKTPAGSAIV